MMRGGAGAMAECLKRKEDAVRRERLNRPGEGVDYACKQIVAKKGCRSREGPPSK